MKTTEIITTQEASRRKVLEKTITKGIGTVLKVGAALTEIKENRLYRDKFKSFAEYCDKKWGFTRMRAHQLIEASNIQKDLPQDVKKFYTNASQLNALADIPKEERGAAAKEIIESIKNTGGNVTASAITTAVKQNHPRKPLPRGGLAAEALRGIDLTKLDTAQEPPAPPAPDPVAQEPIIPPPAAKLPEEPAAALPKMTPAQCQKELNAMRERIKAVCNIPAEHQKYGVIFNTAANEEMNWTAGPRREYNPYGR